MFWPVQINSIILLYYLKPNNFDCSLLKYKYDYKKYIELYFCHCIWWSRQSKYLTLFYLSIFDKTLSKNILVGFNLCTNDLFSFNTCSADLQNVNACGMLQTVWWPLQVADSDGPPKSTSVSQSSLVTM